jgi:hypothetical protein
MMREKQLPWSIFIGVSLTFVDNSLTFVDRFFFRTLTILYFRTSLEAFRALGSRALKSEGSELFFDCQKLYGRNRYHHT